MNLKGLVDESDRPDFAQAGRILRLALEAAQIPDQWCRLDGDKTRALQHPGALSGNIFPIERLLLSSVGQNAIDVMGEKIPITRLCWDCAALAIYARNLWGPPFGGGYRVGAYSQSVTFVPDGVVRMPGQFTASVPWREESSPDVWARENPAEAVLWPMPNFVWLHETSPGRCGVCSRVGPAVGTFSIRGGDATWPGELLPRHPCLSYGDSGGPYFGLDDTALVQSAALRHPPEILADVAPGTLVRWMSSRSHRASLRWLGEGVFPWRPGLDPRLFDTYAWIVRTVVPQAVRDALSARVPAALRDWDGSALQGEVVNAAATKIEPLLTLAVAGGISLAEFYELARSRGLEVFRRYAETRSAANAGEFYQAGLHRFNGLLKWLRGKIGLENASRTPARVAAARENGRRGGRKPRVDWAAWDERIRAGESAGKLAVEIGCTRQMVYNRRTALKQLTGGEKQVKG